jgi:large subunit ribosomal protein L18
VDKDLRAKVKGMKKTEQAKAIGQAIAERAKGKGVSRPLCLTAAVSLCGRVKALADGAREGGLQF